MIKLHAYAAIRLTKKSNILKPTSCVGITKSCSGQGENVLWEEKKRLIA